VTEFPLAVENSWKD
jgi:rubredoxin